MGGVMPFMPVMAKGLGISATAVGLVFTIVPFCVFFSKPLFGFLTDYFKNIKLIVFLLACVTSVSYLSTIFIPAIDNPHWTQVGILRCEDKRIDLVPYDSDAKCLKDVLQRDAECELSYRLCGSDIPVDFHGVLSIYHPDVTLANSSSVEGPSNSTITLRFRSDSSNISCDCISDNSSQLRCVGPILNSCLGPTDPSDSSVYSTMTFWLFTLFVVIAGTGAATVFCLSDAACYEVLGDQPENYGKQRLWGTLSWGIVTLLAGLLNDLATGDSATSSYNPGFYVMIGLVIIDLLLLLKIKLTKTNFSLNICQDIGKIFSSCQSVAFGCAVYIVGALTGLIWNYQFWYLQDLGASQTLMGLTVAVQCIIAEVPFFFFAGWFIKTFGYFYCLSCVFSAFALRFGLYCVLEDPWFVLPIEVLHGVTFAVFYSSMTGYASNFAPPGTEATMMGILGGLFEGLGKYVH